MKIAFVMPNHGATPWGGYRVIYEHANRLSNDGFQVTIIYAGSLFWKRETLYGKLMILLRYLYRNNKKRYSCRNWYQLDSKIEECYVISLAYRHVPKCDVYICTTPQTAMYVNNYPSTNKFYYIQGYDRLNGITDEILRETYHYPLYKIVVSKWLYQIINNEEHEPCNIVENGIDHTYFHQTILCMNRDKYCVSMLYSPITSKDFNCGFEALKIVKKRYNQLKVEVFGTCPRPDFLPEWYNYVEKPNQIMHNKILNESSIFVATSKKEGWGLTIGEAMACGAAVACTDNAGYLEIVKDRENALVSPIGDYHKLAENIIQLIDDDEMRIKMAEAGHLHIKHYTWDRSYHIFKDVLLENCVQ